MSRKNRYTLIALSICLSLHTANVSATPQISRPAEGEVITAGTLTIEATCDNADTISATLGQTTPISALGTLSTHITLPEPTVTTDHLTITCTAANGTLQQHTRTLHFEPSTQLSVVQRMGGPILDIDNDYILYHQPTSSGDLLQRYHRASDTHEIIPIPSDAAVRINAAYLTPTGVITSLRSNHDTTVSGIYDWRHHTLEHFSPLHQSYSLKVAGDYAIWDAGNTLLLRTFSRGTLTQVSDATANTRNDIATDGTVLYTRRDDHQIYTYHNGIHTQLSYDHPDTLWNYYPQVGDNASLYIKSTPCCDNLQEAIALHDNATEYLLTPFSETTLLPGRDYQISGNTIAYTMPGYQEQSEVWLRSQDMPPIRLTHFDSASDIESLNEAGSLVLINDHNRYIAELGHPLQRVSSSQGRSVWLNDAWHIIVGNTLFQVNK